MVFGFVFWVKFVFLMLFYVSLLVCLNYTLIRKGVEIIGSELNGAVLNGTELCSTLDYTMLYNSTLCFVLLLPAIFDSVCIRDLSEKFVINLIEWLWYLRVAFAFFVKYKQLSRQYSLFSASGLGGLKRTLRISRFVKLDIFTLRQDSN